MMALPDASEAGGFTAISNAAPDIPNTAATTPVSGAQLLQSRSMCKSPVGSLSRTLLPADPNIRYAARSSRAQLVGCAAQTRSLHETQGGARQTTGVPEGEQLDPKTQFRQLYDQEFHSVFRSIRAVVLDTAAAEDLTQETFVRAYRART